MQQDEGKILFDIETVGRPIESFSDDQQKYLLKNAKTPEEIELAIQGLNLSALTAEIVCIGIFDINLNYAGILYQSKKESGEYMLSSIQREEWLDKLFKEGISAKFFPMDEKGILTKFWETIKNYRQIITFNGRNFDVPFVLLRSAYHKIKPTKDLMPYRYSYDVHCDLMDQLNFYGATRRYNLDFYCNYFNIESPKSHGVTGLDMNTLFNEEKYQDIAKYCLGDISATAKLYKEWDKYLNPKNFKR